MPGCVVAAARMAILDNLELGCGSSLAVVESKNGCILLRSLRESLFLHAREMDGLTMVSTKQRQILEGGIYLSCGSEEEKITVKGAIGGAGRR